MPKHLIAVEFEAINREGETQVVRDSGLPVQGYSVYLRASSGSQRSCLGHLGGRLRHNRPCL